MTQQRLWLARSTGVFGSRSSIRHVMLGERAVTGEQEPDGGPVMATGDALCGRPVVNTGSVLPYLAWPDLCRQCRSGATPLYKDKD
jgi:hypothetical protein